MAKTPRVPSTRSARLVASFYSLHRPRGQNASDTLARRSCNPSLTPSEFFMQSLHVDERDVGVDVSAVCPGASTQVLLKIHVEVSFSVRGR